MRDPLDLQAIRARVKAAAPAPWVAEFGNVTDGMGYEAAECLTSEDAAFIAAARQDIPALCDELEALRTRLAAVEAAGRKVVAMAPSMRFECNRRGPDPDGGGWYCATHGAYYPADGECPVPSFRALLDGPTEGATDADD